MQNTNALMNAFSIFLKTLEQTFKLGYHSSYSTSRQVTSTVGFLLHASSIWWCASYSNCYLSTFRYSWKKHIQGKLFVAVSLFWSWSEVGVSSVKYRRKVTIFCCEFCFVTVHAQQQCSLPAECSMANDVDCQRRRQLSTKSCLF